jgi:hypothetical protein
MPEKKLFNNVRGDCMNLFAIPGGPDRRVARSPYSRNSIRSTTPRILSKPLGGISMLVDVTLGHGQP